MLQSFKSLKPWVRGGAIGAVVCTMLFGFYLFIYFPVLRQIVESNPSSEEPSWELTLPTVTGHILPFMTHFAVEESSLPKMVCKETETDCLAWSYEYDENGISWTDGRGGTGYCLEQEESPLASCMNRLESAALLAAITLLEFIYFIIGALIAVAIERRKKHA